MNDKNRKTTTIKILSTLLKPSWGEARINNKVPDTATVQRVFFSIFPFTGDVATCINS